MTKSNARSKSKRRKAIIELSPEQLKELEDLERRMAETDRRIEETLKLAAETLRKLDRISIRR